MTARFHSENIHSNHHLSCQEFNPQTSSDPRINHLRSERHNSSFLPSITNVSTSLDRNLAVCSVGNAGYSVLLLVQYCVRPMLPLSAVDRERIAQISGANRVHFIIIFRLKSAGWLAQCGHSSTVQQACTNDHGHTTILRTTRIYEHSCNSNIQTCQPTRCINLSHLLFVIWIQLNMFRASSYPSSGAYKLL
jgi:hypothetical protein